VHYQRTSVCDAIVWVVGFGDSQKKEEEEEEEEGYCSLGSVST